MAGRGAGRGRGMVLPAWMTKGGVTPGAAPTSTPASAPAFVPPSAPPGGLQNNHRQEPPSRSGFQPPMRPPPAFVPPSLGRGSSEGRQLPYQAPPRAPAAAPRAAAPAVPAIPPAEVAANWGEHKAPDGRSYYYNRITKVSTYDRPACMPKLATPAPAAAASGAAKVAAAKADVALPVCKWKEYDHGGKKYYSDGATSLWEKPQELKDYEAALEANKLKAAAALASDASAVKEEDSKEAKKEPEKEKEKEAKKEKPVVDISKLVTKEDKLAGFQQLLEEVEVTSSMKWAEIEKLCSDDPRWGLLKKGEKRQTTTEYQNRRQKEEIKEERLRAKKAKDAFLKMLATNFNIDGNTRWSEAKDMISSDPRYKAVTEERLREEIFMEFTEELSKADREDQLKRLAEARKSFADLVANASRHGLAITHLTRWPDVEMALADMAAGNSSLSVLTDMERKRILAEHVMDLQREEDARRAREKEEKRREDNRRRKDFEEFLRQQLAAGSLNADTKWKDLRQTIEDEDVYKRLEEVGGAAPRDVFEKIVDELRQQFREDRRLMDDLQRAASFTVVVETTQKEYEDALIKEETRLIKERFPNLKLDDDDGEPRKDDDSKKDDGADEDRKSSRRKSRDGSGKDQAEAHRRFAEMVVKRPVNVHLHFGGLMERAILQRRDDERKRARLETDMKELLEECFYRSDHVDMSWSDAKVKLAKRGPAMSSLPEDTRKRLFNEHMAKLGSLMAKKEERLQKLKEERKAKKEAATPAPAPRGREKEREEGELAPVDPMDDDAGGSSSRKRSSAALDTKSGKDKRGRSSRHSSSGRSSSRSSSRGSRRRDTKRSRNSRSRSRSRTRKSSKKHDKHDKKHKKEKKHKRSRHSVSRSRDGDRDKDKGRDKEREKETKKTRNDSVVDDEEGEIKPVVNALAQALKDAVERSGIASPKSPRERDTDDRDMDGGDAPEVTESTSNGKRRRDDSDDGSRGDRSRSPRGNMSPLSNE